jgi:hypothetical protein
MTSPRLSIEKPPTCDLIERGRLALQELQSLEEAARYRAEASVLQAATLKAELGDTLSLQTWLDSHETSTGAKPLGAPPSIETKFANQERSFRRIDLPVPPQRSNDLEPSVSSDPAFEPEQRSAPEHQQSPNLSSPSELEKPTVLEGSWDRMVQGATDRLKETTDRATDPSASEPLAQEPNVDWLVPGDQNETQSTRKSWRAAAHVWVSLAVHIALVIILSVVFITAAKKAELLSIISSPVDTDRVLTETPMEMISDLQAETLEPSMSTSEPNISDLIADVSMPAIALETGLEPMKPESSASAAQMTASPMQGMTGAKIAAGVEFFGTKATGNTFIYIVDSSPSMKKDKAFEFAKQEVLRSLQSMKPKQRYFLSFFGKEVDPLTFGSGDPERYPVAATPENLEKTMKWLARVSIQKDGWPPNDALQMAIDMEPDAIFMLFDGDTKVDVAKFLRRVNRIDDIFTSDEPRVPIHVVHFFVDEYRKQMMQIAEENGGTYRFIPRPQNSNAKKR